MIIDLQEQWDRDFDWFAVDAVGQLAHFTTAGMKKLPQSVAASAEDLALVTRYFEESAAHRCRHEVESTISNRNDERYLRSFIAMANKGLFSFDIESHLSPAAAYFRVATPTSPTHLSELPTPVGEIVARTRIGGTFRERLHIPYDETVPL
jgi:hypothetical protein